MHFEPRHIQNHSAGGETQEHWGYPDRIIPCKNDAGSCAYLDTAYLAHDRGMLYMGILWATIFGILLIWTLARRACRPPIEDTAQRSQYGRSALGKLRNTVISCSRRFLLPDANKFLFGRTTRFQVVILALLAGYLLIWSFLGISYNTWITPVAKQPGVYNTRTGLGPWSNRVGVIAYALTPLSVLLSSRESLLSVLTGLSYQRFNFLHRWVGYIVLAQSILHTIGWCVVQLRLYQPQPSVSLTWIVESYIIWGLVAMILLLMMFLLSTPWGVRLTGYEFFRKAHIVLAMVYIGACWAHWKRLECFLVPAFILWGIDRGARFVRLALLHYHPASSALAGFTPAQARIKEFRDAKHGDVVRLDLENEQECWKIGHHYYLCFTELSIWQSHPFTPLNAPVVENGRVRHSYIMRVKSGETEKLANLARKKADMMVAGEQASTTPVLLTGGYGEDLLDSVDRETNIVCVAGGTGITFVLPILLQLARSKLAPDRKVDLIWAMRHSRNTKWVQDELSLLREAQGSLNLSISLFATRDVAKDDEKETTKCRSGKELPDIASSSSEGACPCDSKAACSGSISVARIGGGDSNSSRHPDLNKMLGDFVDSTVSGRTIVFASGPGGMITDLRRVVASLNAPAKVWRRQEKCDVELVCDNRLEW